MDYLIITLSYRKKEIEPLHQLMRSLNKIIVVTMAAQEIKALINL